LVLSCFIWLCFLVEKHWYSPIALFFMEHSTPYMSFDVTFLQEELWVGHF
jgi:hypothetical protein